MPINYWLVLAFAGLTAFPIWLGYQIGRWQTSKKIVTPMPIPQRVGLEVYTRAEVEEQFPFEPFVSQVKHGGELVMMVAAFAARRYKTDAIKRLITEKNVTVTILLLAPFRVGNRTDEIEREFNWQGLTVEIEQTLVVLCKLRKELKELKDRLIIRTYDRTPILSLIVVDPNTEDAIMQVGSYLSGTDPSARFVTMVSKRTSQDVFKKYWAEYLYMCSDECSSPFNCKRIEHLISS
jgi:hypothetical protein